jgi:CBS domain-containing protein
MMKVRDVMQKQVITVAEDESLAVAQQRMLWSSIRHLPVRRKPDGRVIGVLSERDVLRSYRQLRAEPDGFNRPVNEFMTRPADHIHPEAELADAAADMATRKIGCLPVIEVGALVGIITTSDVLASVAQYPADYRRKEKGGRGREGSVASIMFPDPIAMHPSDPVVTMAARLAQAGVRHACVVDGAGCIAGIVSDRDVRRVLGDPMRALTEESLPAVLRELRVEHIMTANPRTVLEDEPISCALSLLLSTRFGALPVVDANDRLRGIVSYLDVLKHFEQASSK